jgi:hypothetical protein
MYAEFLKAACHAEEELNALQNIEGPVVKPFIPHLKGQLIIPQVPECSVGKTFTKFCGRAPCNEVIEKKRLQNGNDQRMYLFSTRMNRPTVNTGVTHIVDYIQDPLPPPRAFDNGKFNLCSLPEGR